MEILAGPAASVREAKRLIQAGADGIVAGTGCDVGGDPAAPQAVALGRGEATMVYEVRADLHGTRTWKSCFFWQNWDKLWEHDGEMVEQLWFMFSQIKLSGKEPLGIKRGNGNEQLLNGQIISNHFQVGTVTPSVGVKVAS